jgi:hypothetical protein
VQFSADDESLIPEVPAEFTQAYYLELWHLNDPWKVTCFISRKILFAEQDDVFPSLWLPKPFEDLTPGEKWHLYHCSDLIHPAKERHGHVAGKDAWPLKPENSPGPLPICGGSSREGRESGPVHISKIAAKVMKEAEWNFYINNVIKPGVCRV